MSNNYKALVIEEQIKADGKSVFEPSIQTKELPKLKEDEVLIKIHYSSLNYKDALSATGNKGITRTYPHTPGIDLAGIVSESKSPKFNTGDEVICTGYDLGMNTNGGFSEYAVVPNDWIVKKPEKLSLRSTMIIGTAGFTAATAVMEIINYGIKPEESNVLVTGATGGVGILAVNFLTKLNYNVIAASGKPEQYEMLKKAGAKEIIDRNKLNDNSNKPLLKQQYDATIDTVGGNILATAIKSTNKYGIVTTCGNIISTELNISIFPFILRGVRLIGLASAENPMSNRIKIWQFINDNFADLNLNYITTEITLQNVMDNLHLMLNGKQKGRVIIKL